MLGSAQGGFGSQPARWRKHGRLDAERGELAPSGGEPQQGLVATETVELSLACIPTQRSQAAEQKLMPVTCGLVDEL